MKKTIVLALVLAAVTVPAIVYFAGPLFINTTIDEPAPSSSADSAMDLGDKMIGNDQQSTPQTKLSGSFIGAGDGIHDAKGVATVIPIDGVNVLRLSDFQSTNGPDLYVYLANDNQASDFVSLGRLKANIGNQNYEIPSETDLAKYDRVLIWCQQFSVLFGSAQLGSA